MSLKHENIIHIYSAGVDDLTEPSGRVLGKKQYIVQEFCPNGSLYDFMVQVNLESDVVKALFL
jgi:serine/threonine protein kinase